MGSYIYSINGGIAVRHERSDERRRVRALNRKLVELQEEFEDLNFIISTFDLEDFNEVYAVPTGEGEVFVDMGIHGNVKVVYNPSTLFDRDFCVRHEIPHQVVDPCDLGI